MKGYDGTNPGEWRFISLPAIWEKPYPDELGRAAGSSLWPEVFSAADLEVTRRAVGPSTWASLYQQEPEDSATTGRVFFEFDSKIHVRRVDHTPDLPICVSMDFNIMPATALIAQIDERFGPNAFLTNEKIFRVNVLGEISLPDSNTQQLLAEVDERLRRYILRGRALPVWIFGDASGNQRKTSASESDWEQVKRFFSERSSIYRVNYFVGKANPSVKDSAEKVNALLREQQLTVDPSCAQLIEDFRSCVYRRDSNGNATSQISKADPRRTHTSDCARYLIEQGAGGGNRPFCGEVASNWY